jgi:hypothetical protein
MMILKVSLLAFVVAALAIIWVLLLNTSYAWINSSSNLRVHDIPVLTGRVLCNPWTQMISCAAARGSRPWISLGAGLARSMPTAQNRR